MAKPAATVVFVPGLRDHVEDHWQTILARKIAGSITVPPRTENKLSLKARVDALEETLSRVSGDAVLVAHSAGVLIAAHWAQASTRDVRGALLVTPADIELPLPPGYPALEDLRANGWLPVPRSTLRFRSIVAASSNDPLARLDRAREFAKDWGSELVDLGAVGHMNPASGFGPWPDGIALIDLVGSARPKV